MGFRLGEVIGGKEFVMKRLLLRALVGLCCIEAMAPTLEAGIFAHYTFDTNFEDDSGNSRHGTFVEDGTGNVLGNSGISTTAGDYVFGGGGLNIIGEAGALRDYVSVPSVSFTASDNFSISFWAKRAPGDTAGSGPYQWDMVIGSTANTGNFIALHDGSNSSADPLPADGVLRFRTGGTSTSQQSDWLSINDTDTTWHHHVVVMDGTANTSSYYLDGTLVSTQTGKTNSPFSYNAIGAAYTAASDYDFRGQLDEMWIFDQALTSTEVSSLMNVNAIPEPSVFICGALALGSLVLSARKRRQR